MNFKSYIPSRLIGLVDLIWENIIPMRGNYTVLPSGKVELLFPLYHKVEVKAKSIPNEGNPVKNLSCFLSGIHTKPLSMSFDRFHTFGIRMKPVAVKALFGIPLCKIKDYFVEGNIVLDTVDVMEDKLYTINTFFERAQWFENFFLKKINETADLHIAIQLDNTINRHIESKKGNSFRSIESKLGYSRTQTYRLFNDWFGISSHGYEKLVQFVRSVESLHNKNARLVDIGLDNGYYDQSHFIHSFEEFAEMTPGEYRKQMNSFPGQLIG